MPTMCCGCIQPGSVDATRLSSELGWLSSIRRDTDLLAPFPVGALVDGREQPFLELRHDLLPPPSIVYAALFEYIEGEVKPARDLSAADVYRIGEYLGALHSDAQFKLPGDFDRPRLDWEGLFRRRFALRFAHKTARSGAQSNTASWTR